MSIKEKYILFLKELSENGYSEADFLIFSKDYYDKKLLTLLNKKVMKPRKFKKDGSTYSFDAVAGLGKGKLVFNAVKYLILHRNISVDELNNRFLTLKLTRAAAPLLVNVENISELNKKRYSNINTSLQINGNCYVVLADVSRTLDDMICIFKEAYNLSIDKETHQN